MVTIKLVRSKFFRDKKILAKEEKMMPTLDNKAKALNDIANELEPPEENSKAVKRRANE